MDRRNALKIIAGSTLLPSLLSDQKVEATTSKVPIIDFQIMMGKQCCLAQYGPDDWTDIDESIAVIEAFPDKLNVKLRPNIKEMLRDKSHITVSETCNEANLADTDLYLDVYLVNHRERERRLETVICYHACYMPMLALTYNFMFFYHGHMPDKQYSATLSGIKNIKKDKKDGVRISCYRFKVVK